MKKAKNGKKCQRMFAMIVVKIMKKQKTNKKCDIYRLHKQTKEGTICFEVTCCDDSTDPVCQEINTMLLRCIKRK